MNNYKVIKDLDNMFITSYEEDIEEDFKELSIEEITIKQLKQFIKDNKEEFKELKLNYKTDWIDNKEQLILFKESLFNIKDKFNNNLIDIYNEYKQINKLYKQSNYIRYGADKFNNYLKSKVFNNKAL